MRMKRVGRVGRAVFFLLIAGGMPLVAQIAVELEPLKKNADGKKSLENTDFRRSPDRLRFINGDSLSGEIVSIATDEGLVRWEAPNLRGPVDAAMRGISGIELGSGKAPGVEKKEAEIELSNGDSFCGAIFSLDKDVLLLDTCYAGRLSLKRKMIRRISPGSSQSLLYAGPGDASEWRRPKNSRGGEFCVKDAALTLSNSAMVYRDVKLPGMSRIDFSVTLSFDNRGFRFFFHGGDFERGYDAYCLNVSSNYIQLERYSENNGSQDIWSMNLERESRAKTARYTVLADSKKKSVMVMLDGKMLRQCVDEKGGFARGGCIAFQNQSGSTMHVRGIMVSEWNGSIPKETLEDDVEKTAHDSVDFANGDRASGRIKGIVDGKVEVETDFATLSVPLDKVRIMELSTVSMEKARLNKNDAVFSFRNGGRFTMDMSGLSGGRAKGRSENFGEAEFNVAVFRSIRLNLYDGRADSKEEPELDEE